MFFSFGFEGWISVLIASVSDLCILFTFTQCKMSTVTVSFKIFWYKCMTLRTEGNVQKVKIRD